MTMKKLFRFAALLYFASPLLATSYFTDRLDDPRAVFLTPDKFPVRGDGIVDDSDALQQAIDKVQETTNQGILFVPSGRYRLSRTVYIWPGIRLIGYGKTRPVLVLGANTPAFQTGPSYMIFFAGRRPRKGPFARKSDEIAESKPPDASPGTFYSALSNVDIEIQEGNPGAVGVRAHYAQHCFLAHMDFHLGSALAGIHDAGNVAQDLRFFGGKYGIWTRKPSPGWQFTVIDSVFEGQREAAIREHEAGLTLIRPQFKNVPSAISIDPGYFDELWVKDPQLEDISGPAVFISEENSPRSEINIENAVCRRVPVFASFRESSKQVPGPEEMYTVRTFSHGLHFDDIGAIPAIQDVFDAFPLTTFPLRVDSDIRDLPPMNTWVSIRTLGAVGDGSTDDTAALRKAISEHQTIYFPTGQYRVSDTITLKPDTVLIGLHPSITRILLADGTPAFQGVGSPKPLLETPKGGNNIITGIGLYTNGVNPRAVALQWKASKDSMVDDVRFLGGHGTVNPGATPEENEKMWELIYNNNHTADSNILRRWDGQYPSLWITDGGGGTFLNIWTPSTFAQAGLYISNTATSGRVYELSSEHHVRNEVVLHNVSHWQIYALQTEEERGEGVLPCLWRSAIPAMSQSQTSTCTASLAAISHFLMPSGSTLQKIFASATFTATVTVKSRLITPFLIRPTMSRFASASSPGSHFPAMRRNHAPPNPLPSWPQAPSLKSWPAASSIFLAAQSTVRVIFILWMPNGSQSTVGRYPPISSRLCATILSIRSSSLLTSPVI